MIYSEKYSLHNAHSFFASLLSILVITTFLIITPSLGAMQYPMPEQDGQNSEFSSPVIYLPSFATWCKQTRFYRLNTPEGKVDQTKYMSINPELADQKYTDHLLGIAQRAWPNHHFENFNSYVREWLAHGDGCEPGESGLERWTGKSTIELYKNYLENQIAELQEQEIHEQALSAQQVRARIALRIIPGLESLEIDLQNRDSWESFQEKIARETGIPAQYQEIKIGGTGDANSLEDLITWIDSGKCALVIDSRRKQ